jgi:hypothetical protein
MEDLYTLIKDLKPLSSKKDIGLLILNRLTALLKPNYASFVSKENDSLKVICQIGDVTPGKNIFNKETSENIYDLVCEQKKTTTLKLGENDLFFFIPLIDNVPESDYEHGMFVLNFPNGVLNLDDEMKEKVNFICDLGSLALSRILIPREKKKDNVNNENSSELDLLSKVQVAISGTNQNKKILFNVIEDVNAIAEGKTWWIDELGSDITLVLIAEAKCEGLPAALINGYILGLMKGLKGKAEIALKPEEALKYLNKELNLVFKEASLLVNAWYGVFNLDARRVRFANANHPEPYLIGPEQQVTRLIVEKNKNTNSLGLNVNSDYAEGNLYISSGSKLVIFTKDLLEKAQSIGEKHDPYWLPQVLETVGALPLSEMRKSLDNILSESASGTAFGTSRLALLLEIPS